MLRLISKTAAISASAVFTLYAGFIAFLWGIWFLDDAVGPYMSTADWVFAAFGKVVEGSLLAAFVGLTIYGLLRLVYGWRTRGAIRDIPFKLSASAFSLVFAVSLGASIHFFIEKPWF